MTIRDRLDPSIAASEASPASDRSSVFISYRHVDRNVADELFALLVKRKVPAWYDPLIPHGSDWREAIVAQLSTACVMVILLSPGAFESEELKKELAVAVQAGVPLLAVRLADVKPPGAFAYELARSQWFDLFIDPPERLAALVELLEKISQGLREADLPALYRKWQQRLPTTGARRSGLASRLASNNLFLFILFFFVSSLVLVLYERSARPLEDWTAAGVIAPWRACLYLVGLSSVGSPVLFLTRPLHGIQLEDLPLLAATAANTVVLILLARNLVAWLRLQLLAARGAR